MSTTSAIVLDRLIAWGVNSIFGLIGDGINPLLEALRQREDRIRFIAVRHEETAGFMACAHAKYTGKLGVCLATSGPGALHLPNSLYDADFDGVPVLAITGMPVHDLLGTQYKQDVDTVALFRDVARYNVMINGPQHAETVVGVCGVPVGIGHVLGGASGHPARHSGTDTGRRPGLKEERAPERDDDLDAATGDAAG